MMPFKNTKDPYVKKKKAEYARRYRERHPEKFNQPKTEAQKQYAKAATQRHRERNREKINAQSREKAMQARRIKGIGPRLPKMTKEQSLARARELYVLNIEKSRAKEKKYREAHKDKTKAHNETYRKLHREDMKAKRAEQRQRWNSEDREKNNAKEREYYRKDPGKSKIRQAAKAATRRALRKGSGGIVTAAEIAELYVRQAGRCATCKAKIAKTGGNKFHVDHVKPLASGGLNAIENVALLCEPCNLRKGTSDPFEWAEKHGLLFI